MKIYKAGLGLMLFAGVGMMLIAPTSARPQAQDQHQQGNQKPQQGHAAKPAQKGHAAKPAQQSHPQASHTARPAQPSRPQASHAARPAQQSRPQASHAARPAQPSHGARPSSNARPQAQARPQARSSRGSQSRPNYQFRSQDTSRLRQYYQGGFGRINRAGRPSFSRGGYIPRTYWGDFQPVPPSMIGYLPAVPPGYAIGYYDGYVVVYNPTTYLIVSVLNLLQ